MLADLGRQRLCQLDDGGLGRAVAEQAGAARVHGSRGHGDDAAPDVPGEHQPGGLLAGVEHALEIDVQYPVQVLVTGLQDRAAVHDPGDRGHDVETPAGGDGPAELVAVGDVQMMGVGGASHVLDAPRRLLQARRVAVRAVHGGAGAGPAGRRTRGRCRSAVPVTKAVRPVRSYALTAMRGRYEDL